MARFRRVGPVLERRPAPSALDRHAPARLEPSSAFSPLPAGTLRARVATRVLVDVDMNGDARMLPADSGHRVEEPTVAAFDRLLTAEQLAARWQVPKSHVYRLTREGRIPTVRLGRYYRYRLAAVEAWERQSEALVAAAA